MADEKRWLSFDPTIHAGHLLTAISIIIVGVSNYYAIQSQIELLKVENAQRKEDIAALKADATASNAAINNKIDTLVTVQRQEVGQLRDDMKGWFMSLDLKLDRKADKK